MKKLILLAIVAITAVSCTTDSVPTNPKNLLHTITITNKGASFIYLINSGSQTIASGTVTLSKVLTGTRISIPVTAPNNVNIKVYEDNILLPPEIDSGLSDWVLTYTVQ